MIGQLIRALIARTTGPECAYPALAREAVEGRLAEEPS